MWDDAVICYLRLISLVSGVSYSDKIKLLTSTMSQGLMGMDLLFLPPLLLATLMSLIYKPASPPEKGYFSVVPFPRCHEFILMPKKSTVCFSFPLKFRLPPLKRWYKGFGPGKRVLPFTYSFSSLSKDITLCNT